MITTIGNNGKNYLLKSGARKDPEQTVLKDIGLQTLLLNNLLKPPINNSLKLENRRKTRLLVKKGIVYISLLLADVAVIYTKNKLVYVIDHDSKKYTIDQTLSELETRLDNTIFFRVNRQYIININFVKSFKVYQKVKLLVDINIPEFEYRVIISQHLSSSFKKWMNDA